MPQLAYDALILAGGKGSRLNADIPKPLYELAGVTLLDRVLQNILPITPRPIILLGHRGEDIRDATRGKYRYAWQKQQLGTGHAVYAARDEIAKSGAANVLIVCADHPFLRATTIKRFIDFHTENENRLSLASVTVPNFSGIYKPFYASGRILRDEQGQVKGIVEYKDATDAERSITEVNVSCYCFRVDWLLEHIEVLMNTTQRGEYYLTDMVHIAVKQHATIGVFRISNPRETLGVNSPDDARIAEQYAQPL